MEEQASYNREKSKQQVKSHAERELQILEKTVPDSVILPFAKEITDLYKAFGNSGQSGGSAPYVVGAIANSVKKLLMRETISPLTGQEDEWTNLSDLSGGLENRRMGYQNKRDGRIFKDNNGTAWFVDAIVFVGLDGVCFTGNAVKSEKYGNLGSAQNIKSFPFTPKTFYIDVTDFRYEDKEGTRPNKNGDYWDHVVKDDRQLERIFEYYDKRE